MIGSALFSKYYARLRLRFLVTVVVGVVAGLFLLKFSVQPIGAVVLNCALLGLAMTALNVSLQSEVIRNSRLDDQAVATSIYSGIFNLGIGSGSALGGAVCTYITVGDVGIAGGLFGVVALAYALIVLVPRLRAPREAR